METKYTGLAKKSVSRDSHFNTHYEMLFTWSCTTKKNMTAPRYTHKNNFIVFFATFYKKKCSTSNSLQKAEIRYCGIKRDAPVIDLKICF